VVERVGGEQDDFRVTLNDGREFRSRRLLLCTGLRDIIPEIPGLMDFYGTSIWHCPECDGPSATGRKIGVIGWGEGIVKYSMWMLTWAGSVVLMSHGRPARLTDDARDALERHGIPVKTEAITRLEGENGQVRRVVFHDGSTEEVEAVFFHIASGPGSTFPAELGCGADEDGILEVDNNFETTVPGVYAAGDITPGTRLAIRAAYEGTRAAIGIQKSLLPDDRRL